MSERIAIVGSRDYPNAHVVVGARMKALPKGCTIVSGGARGVDSIAAHWADMLGYKKVIYLPDWDAHGKSAGYLRNVTIVDNSDLVIAFWDGTSKGTKHTIDIAMKKGIPVEIICPDTNQGTS